MSTRIPVTVLTGFLGSGKTTLLNRILSEEHGLRIAVIENEFGEIGIDQDLVINVEEEIFEMSNGCICCTMRSDLIRILGELAERKEKFDRVVIETTGVADPGPIAKTFFADRYINFHYELDGIITLVDSKHVDKHLDEKTHEVLAQIAFADRIILNKVDLVTEEQTLNLKRRLQTINHITGFYSTTMANAPIDELLDIGGFNLERAMEVKSNFLESDDHHHNISVSSVSIELPGLFDYEKLNPWLEIFLQTKGEDLYRMKGVLGVKGEVCRVVFQGVHMLLGAQTGEPWGDEEPVNKMVFIGKDLDENYIRSSLERCLYQKCE